MAQKPENPPLVAHRKSRITASLAEFFLIFRLRARRTPRAAVGMMDRAHKTPNPRRLTKRIERPIDFFIERRLPGKAAGGLILLFK